MYGVLPQFFLLFFLLAFSSYFSVCEIALTALNKIKLKVMLENNVKGAKKVEQVTKDSRKLFSTILVGSNITNIVAPVVATSIAIKIGGNNPLTIGISTVLITSVVLIYCEMVPKMIAVQHPEKISLTVAGSVRFFMVVFTPFIFVFSLISRFSIRLLGGDPNKANSFMTEDELISLINVSEDEGVLEEQESNLVRSALEFDETTVGEILTPRVSIVAVSLADSVEKIRDVFLEEGYSRLPVYDKTPDDIVGVVKNKDFTGRLLIGEEPDTRAVMQDVLHIPALMKLSEALKLMQNEKSHLAVVVDQYGGTEGIVTLEDILEELVGEIWDEGDEEKLPVKFMNNGAFEAEGKLALNDFNRFFEKKGMDVAIDSESNTVGGWAFELFGKIPAEGDRAENGRFKITVLSMEGKRIGRLRFEIKQTAAV
ncbi:MAG: hemolysin family protein [Oscillospiraceae bacterium]|jgi:CBS domain containing-hemolysin-like protein|nr:hemolysin family protein [Oscillospiraceae bacterium]